LQGFYAIMKLKILGCGEASDARYGNTAALLYDNKMPTILFDCGYQIPERLWQEGKLSSKIDAVWLSHLHADHYFGIVPLLTRYWEEGRKKPLHIFGPPGVIDHIQELMELGYPTVREKFMYDVLIKEMDEEQSVALSSLTLRCARSNHSVVNLSVRVEIPDGTSLAISGDGALSLSTRELFKGVDLLMHEVFSHHSITPIHMNLDDLEEYIRATGIGRVGITHVSRFQREDVASAVREISARDPRWFMAQPGMELEITHQQATRLAG
jgi:ribonuclease Z